MEIKKIKYAVPVLIGLSVFAGGLKDERYFFVFAAIFSFLFLKENIPLKAGPWLYFVVWSFLSSLFSSSPVISLFWSFKLFIFYAVYCYFSAKKEIFEPYFDKILGGAAAALAVYIALSSNILHKTDAWMIFGANPNYIAALFSVCALIFFNIAAAGDSFFEKFKAYFVFAAFFILISVFNSRAAFLAVCAASLYISYFRQGKSKAIYWGILFGFVFIYLAFHNDLLKLKEAKSYARPLIWITALKAAWYGPLWGFGSGLFSRAFEMFKFPYFENGFYYMHFTAHSHSQPLQILAETGFTGLFFFLWGLKKDFYDNFKTGSVYIAAVLYLLIHGLFDVLFYLPFFWLCLFACLGLLSKAGTEENLRFSFSKAAFFFAIMSGLGFFQSVKEPLDSKAAARTAGFRSVNAFRTAAYCEIYRRDFPKDWIYPYFLSKFYYLAGQNEKAGQLAVEAYSLEPAAFEKEARGGPYAR